jgi:hypothetical protein
MPTPFMFIICLVLILTASTCSAQKKTDTGAALDSLLTPGQMIADLDTLYKVILDTHQNPFFFCTKAELERAYQTTRRECKTAMPLIDFSAKIAGMMGTLKDSHSYLQYTSLLGKYAIEGLYYGFGVKAIKGDIFVSRDFEDLIPVGSKLISINGLRSTVVFNKVNQLSVQEGNSLTGRLRISEILFSRFSGMFTEISDSNRVEFIPHGQDSIHSIRYPGKTAKEWAKTQPKSAKSKIVTISFNDTIDVAVLKISSFSAGKDRHYYKALRQSFKELNSRGTQHLAIDLRSNTGGKSERMEQLFAYLSTDTICSPTNIIARQSPLSIKRYNTTIKRFQRWLMRHAPKKSEDLVNYIHMMDLELGKSDTVYYTKGEQVKSKLVYKNQSYVLMDGGSASASANFAGTYQMHELGEIWGEPCLGPAGGTWGNPSDFKLPKSGIVVYISTIRFNNSNDMLQDASPVKPDHRIELDPEYLARDVDIVLEKLLEHISK